MNDFPQEYFDVHISFLHIPYQEMYNILFSLTRMYGYQMKTAEMYKTNTKFVVRFHQSAGMSESPNISFNRIEASVRKFISVLSIETDRINESAICWWTLIVPVKSTTLV